MRDTLLPPKTWGAFGPSQPALAQRDLFQVDHDLATRFDRRVDFGLAGVFAVFLVLLCFQIVLAPTASHLPHMVTVCLAVIAVWAARDAISQLFYAGTALTFTFMLYLNASVHLQPIDSGLIDPITAGMITLVSQAGVTCVALLDRALPQRGLSPAVAQSRAVQMHDLATVLFVIVVGGLALDLAGFIPPIVAESLRFLIPIPLALRFLTRPPTLRDPWLLILAGMMTLLAVQTNARSDLLTVGLMLGFVYLVHARRLLLPVRLILLWVAVRLVGVFSAIAIAVRPLREDPAAMIAEFRDRILSVETLVAVVDPAHTHSAHAVFASRQTDTVYFTSAFFRGATASLFDRLTLLPQMDIVTGRLPAPDAMNVGLWLWATVGSAMPNVGQDKMNMLGDVIVWDLALRPRDSVGRPMITAQAEAWSIGGYPAVFLTAILVFGAWAVCWRLLSRQIALRTVLILMASMFMVYGLFSTTLTSQTLSFMRMPLQTMAGLAALMLVARLLVPRPRMGGWPQPQMPRKV